MCPVCGPMALSTKELAECQTKLSEAVATVYQASSTSRDVAEVLLETGSWRLKRLWEVRSFLFVSSEGFLKLTVSALGRTSEVVVYPQNLQEKVLWDTHCQTHRGR